MLQSVADRAYLPFKRFSLEIGAIVLLTSKTVVSAIQPPYPYGKELVAQFLFALRLCWFPMILASLAFTYGPSSPAGSRTSAGAGCGRSTAATPPT